MMNVVFTARIVRKNGKMEGEFQKGRQQVAVTSWFDVGYGFTENDLLIYVNDYQMKQVDYAFDKNLRVLITGEFPRSFEEDVNTGFFGHIAVRDIQVV